jgi:hypothetical protein
MEKSCKNPKSNEELKELSYQLSVMRREGPQLISKWMDKEKKGLQENLVRSQ